MKIRAVRLREVGIFRDPVAVEGFSGGLDMLAGPNELGKSTILRALERLFFLQPSSKHKDIEALRPTGGGAPLIEADFEAHGRLWRLRKQFLLGRGAAELTDIATGQVRERGPDAHARALELIGLSGDGDRGMFGLLWVSQEDGPKPAMVGASERDVLLSAIESEVAEVADGQGLRELRRRIAEELEPFVTLKTLKPRGDYDKALKDVAALDAEFKAAREQARLGEQRQADLEALRARNAELIRPARMAAGQQAVIDARRAVDDARRSREQLTLARNTRAAHEQACARLDAEAKSLRDRLADHRQQSAMLAEATTRIATVEAAQSTARHHCETTAVRRVDAETALQTAQSQLALRERLDALDDQRRRLAEAHSAASEHVRLGAEIAAITTTDALVRKAGAEQAAIDTLRAQLDAAAPRIAIRYLPGVRDAITADGQPLSDGAELRPATPLVLDIAGVGRITITPVANFDLADTHADLHAREQELAAVLARMRVADLAGAREALAHRRDLEAQRTAAASRLTLAARDGLDRLEAVVAAAESALEVAGYGGEDVPARDQLHDTVRALDKAYRDAVQAEGDAGRTLAVHGQTLAGLVAKADAARARLTVLDAELAAGDPQQRLATLDADLAQATTALNSAIRDVAAFAETAPSDDAWAVLQAAVVRQEQAISTAANEVSKLAQELARLEGELSGSGDHDIHQRIAEIAGALARARARAAYCESEVAALTLLSRLIDEAASASQERFLAPVLARIAPYLSAVLPQTRLNLSKELVPAGLVRASGTDGFATLSGGTREQLAVLTRLGFGRLLADRGQAAPVILDDALVYSDDERIERLFGVLRAASEHHQVIVMTCRSRVFETLGGTPLKITPWRVST